MSVVTFMFFPKFFRVGNHHTTQSASKARVSMPLILSQSSSGLITRYCLRDVGLGIVPRAG